MKGNIILPCVIKNHRCFIEELLLPVAEKIWLNIVFGCNCIKSFSPLSSSITNSDLNLAEKFLLVRDIIIILLSVVFTVYQIH